MSRDLTTILGARVNPAVRRRVERLAAAQRRSLSNMTAILIDAGLAALPEFSTPPRGLHHPALDRAECLTA
jgi:hypothetical protein